MKQDTRVPLLLLTSREYFSGIIQLMADVQETFLIPANREEFRIFQY